MAKTGLQARMTGNGMDAPPPIQAIEDAAAEFLRCREDAKQASDSSKKAQLNVMAKMRVSKRAIYTYKDVTFTIDEKLKLKVKEKKHRSTAKASVGKGKK